MLLWPKVKIIGHDQKSGKLNDASYLLYKLTHRHHTLCQRTAVYRVLSEPHDQYFDEIDLIPIHYVNLLFGEKSNCTNWLLKADLVNH